ncbi:MAG: hypothetical protein XD87_0441 [candidate division WS6 bacterium 36_33]|uniref:Uncharacterized protein n=1 Tax=candidate division WS6 bacterium 36_33 TaxID=1641388 RepID=A0A101GY83_9BACT|nr:MAG: hypothetical protein XD87_0441 [candidate division WS6 bacterium 36_33]
MEKKKSFGDIVIGIFELVSAIVLVIVAWVPLFFLFLSSESEMKTEVVNSIELESLKYRGAKLYWEDGNPMPEERLEVFYTVIDSLSDDVKEKYSLDRNPTDFFYLTAEEYYWGELTGGVERKVAAFQRGTEIFLSPLLVDSNNAGPYTSFNAYLYGPWEEFDSNQIANDGDFAMSLVHEYVHVVQFYYPEFLSKYAKDAGWQGDTKPEEDEMFYRVLSSYSLENPSEDMSDTFQYSYLCGNNLEALSEVRLQYIEDFWAIPREEYCRNFH